MIRSPERSGNYRVPDRGYHRERPTTVFVPSAAIVVEILSPDDETLQKFDFYAGHGVDEIFVVNGLHRSVTIFCRRETLYVEVSESALLGVAAATIAAEVDWE
jgi:Uma2 family endonuclease